LKKTHLLAIAMVMLMAVSVTGCMDETEHETVWNIEVETFDILDRGADEEVILDHHIDHWHGDPLEIELGDSYSLGAFIEDVDGNEIELSGEYELRAAYGQDAEDAGIVSIDNHGDHVHINGEEEGETEIVFQIVDNDIVEYQTTPLTVIVE